MIYKWKHNQMAIDTVFVIPYVRASPGSLVPFSAMEIKFTDHVISQNKEILSTPTIDEHDVLQQSQK
jgi:hypothetical protein